MATDRADREMTDRTGKSLIAWLDHAAEKGLLNRNTAGGYRAACQRILEVESNWEELDVSSIDIETMIQRFINLKAGDYTPGSLGTYKSRFRNALDAYLGWADDPSKWKATAPAISRRKQNERPPTRSKRGRGVDTDPNPDPEDPHQQGPGLITYPFPLRPNVDVTLSLPRDLRADEAKRLVAFINALAFDDPKGEDSAS